MAYPRARRLDHIKPFRVMELLARARELEAQGRDIVHMEVGEPDFPTAEPVVEAGVRALREGRTGYTPACGLPELRQAIAAHYRRTSGVVVDPSRILITPGASGALLLALALVADAGDGVLVPDPGYPCNRHFVQHLDARAIPVPATAERRFQPGPDDLEKAWDARCVAAMVASPANPTGTMLAPGQGAALHDWLEARRGVLIVDEIYHGLVYGAAPPTILAERQSVLVVNSFSKYFGMTGWRLGWLVVPDGMQQDAEKLAQNLFIAASTPAQYAALACFEQPALDIFERRRLAFAERRDWLLQAVREIGFRLPAEPEGAFYLYADSSGLAADSQALCHGLLEHAGVAITPGLDFGRMDAAGHVRFAYTSSLERLQLGVDRMAEWLQR
ncbi:MAG: pyridoxal phosphate-dependent aminotransferase [Ectothiorhodospiraceae bacterium]|nr:pyridoxal phosphate-dependent aminotransferase [Ectothiorhodospiraceae bacterium]